MNAPARGSSFDIVSVTQADPLAEPLLAELALEYSTRYGRPLGEFDSELRNYPAAEFEPPGGDLVIAVSCGIAIAGGAFRRYDETTAELKRIWTATTHRRRGYGRVVLDELEYIIGQRGYTRIYLTTGWNQPEAVALYLAAGYTPLYDTTLTSAEVGIHPFEKEF